MPRSLYNSLWHTIIDPYMFTVIVRIVEVFGRRRVITSVMCPMRKPRPGHSQPATVLFFLVRYVGIRLDGFSDHINTSSQIRM